MRHVEAICAQRSRGPAYRGSDNAAVPSQNLCSGNANFTNNLLALIRLPCFLPLSYQAFKLRLYGKRFLRHADNLLTTVFYLSWMVLRQVIQLRLTLLVVPVLLLLKSLALWLAPQPAELLSMRPPGRQSTLHCVICC